MIHSENPFQPEPGDRDQARRFRGRLPAGVTIVTAGAGAATTGLTVSSLFVVEGEPALVYLVVGPTTDLWTSTADSGRFIVHLCRYEDHRLAEVFAGLSPSPGGLFTTVESTPSEWGPVLSDLGDRLYCSFLTREETGWSGVVVGQVDRVEVSDLTDPLIHFRSGYHRLML
ncbi:MAG TPA: flavin reductase [Acidimicrobiia bacterium]|nr:flavin reductase [Acidimicrobiia bacterium]